MIVELHLLQSFAPSNLNRDDTGAPKEAMFGGYSRARISSQAFKRAIRRDSNFADLLEENGGVRTRRLIIEIAKKLSGNDTAPEATIKVVADVFKEGGIEQPDKEDITKLILFLDRTGIDAMAEVFRSHWTELTKGAKQAKDEARAAIAAILVRAVKAPDIGLFGRMVEVDGTKTFGKLQLGVDAASQVAHAISTHEVQAEYDFYTAVDDLLPKGDTGAAMMGVTGFNSACFYRYANVSLDQLLENLKDARLCAETVKSFLRAAIRAIPTGKQNSFAAQNLPSTVFAVVRSKETWSLANAFLKPVRPTDQHDIHDASLIALGTHWGGLSRMYGGDDIIGRWLCTVNDGTPLNTLADARVDSVEQLIAGVMGKVNGWAEEKAGG
ncbi:MAG: type I-E CRISPR-associated protein Cas7/Cse4/CasC [Chloroflexi bacterium]|nr:type I-E CRISPR-associated protein Cas7/Cse4/CasC [Chloroflexota bacterium]